MINACADRERKREGERRERDGERGSGGFGGGIYSTEVAPWTAGQ